MLNILNKIRKIGIITEPAGMYTAGDKELEALGYEVKSHIDKRYAGSFSIRAVDSGSCNACELEIHALSNPFYNIERYGVHFVASPRHADALLVTGAVSHRMAAALQRTWNATPEPRWLIAMGDCAVNGGEFGNSYAMLGGVDKLLKPDVTISGCPPSPKVILQAVLALLRNTA
jgi:Ni,Fe-hydrogenase III small subunit